MFLYWGRRGLTQFTLELARCVAARENLAASVSVSRDNESFLSFESLGAAVFPVSTFSTPAGVLMEAWKWPALRRQVLARLAADQTTAVIDLMPHVWSVPMIDAIKHTGARYIPVIHDATVHPGDYRTRWAKAHLDRALPRADRIVTLSHAVTHQLISTRAAPAEAITTLFHPDLNYTAPTAGRTLSTPVRLLFLGRIMPYKGLGLFLDAVDLLRARGVPVKVAVYGEGALGANAARLAALEATVVNHWLSEAEISTALAAADAVVLSHTEASQSGVVATALGAGLPAIATPVGGLTEQIEDSVTGVIADRIDATAFADAIARLATEPGLYAAIQRGIAAARVSRSMDCFFDALLAVAQRP